MKLTYIEHSCFVANDDDVAMIFDYYRNMELVESIIADKSCVYAFASHSHTDHFNADVLTLRGKYPNKDIRYIFSSDIERYKDVTYLSEGERYEDGNISVKAYGSTDCGVSVFARRGRYTLFHAGDLNNWHWNQSTSLTESRFYEESYLQKLDVIRNEISEIDFVMFPVDPRLGKDYYRGAEQFISSVKTRIFAPMHFHGDFKRASAFSTVCEDYFAGFFDIKKQGDSIELVLD